MPTLNYEDISSVLSYDYLQGTIIEIYPEDDTADVESECEGEEWTILKAPIFYHCEKDSTMRDNGAIEGAASGFAVGDLVVVLKAIGSAASSLDNGEVATLKNADGKASGPEYYVIGHYDGVKECTGDCVVVYATGPDGGPCSHGRGWWFIWDIERDCYIEDLKIGDEKVLPSDFPIACSECTWDAYISDRFGFTTVSRYLIDIEHFEYFPDYTGGKIRVGDFVYQSMDSTKWANVIAVETPDGDAAIYIDDLSILAEGIDYTISASIPIYYHSSTDPIGGGEWSESEEGDNMCSVSVTWPHQTKPQIVEGCPAGGTSTFEGGTGITGTITTKKSPSCGSAFCSVVASPGTPVSPEWVTGSGNYWDPFPWGPESVSYNFTAGINGATLTTTKTYEYAEEYTLNYSSNYCNGGYTAKYTNGENTERIYYATGSTVYSGIGTSQGGESTYTVKGNKDPLGDIEQSKSVTTGVIPGDAVWSGDLEQISANFAKASTRGAAQFYTYPGYAKNTHAQSIKRKNKDEEIPTDRSSALEAAVMALAEVAVQATVAAYGEDCWDPNKYWPLKCIVISGYYYSGKRK